MANPTYLEIKTDVEQELDLLEETFITPAELMSYGNKAIDYAVQQILTIYEDYYLDSALLPLVQGQQTYSLPTGIYASKIRRIVFNDGVNTYEIKRLKGTHKFMDYALAHTGDRYAYFLKNSASSGEQIVLNAPAIASDSTSVTIWYIREPARFAQDTDTSDIPEGKQFIKAFMKVCCLEKDIGNPTLQSAQTELEMQNKNMIDTLTDMVPDEDNRVEADMSTYWEHS